MTALLASVIALGVQASDKVTFEWKPAKGEKYYYKTTNSHPMNMGGGDEDLVISWNSVVTIERIEGKRVWLLIDNDEPTATMGGQEAPGIVIRVPDSTEEHGLDARYFKPKDAESLGFGIYGGFALPSSPIAAGESYESESLKAKYVGLERIAEWDAHRFSFEYRPKEGPWSAGDVWLSAKDLSLIRRSIVMHDVDFGHGPMNIKNDLTRTK